MSHKIKKPLTRVMRQGCSTLCNKCGSTMSKKGFLGLFGELLCHQPKCKNSKSRIMK